MKITPEEIETSGYVLLDKLEHTELIPFVKIYLYKKKKFYYIYLLANIVPLILLGVLCWKYWGTESIGANTILTHFSYGLGFAFALIPLHEYIHVLAYKSQGAKNTSYDMNLAKFYFMAIADKFVANKREFQIVALAPFLCISLALLAGLLFTSPLWSITLLGTLLAHTACCAGDFGLLNYFEFHRDKHLITYDDKHNKISYFYSMDKQTGTR